MCHVRIPQGARRLGGGDGGMTGQGLGRNSLMFFDDGHSEGEMTRMNVCLGDKGFVRSDADHKMVIDELGRSCCLER